MWKAATSGRQPGWFLAGTLVLFVFVSIVVVHGADCNGNGREDLLDVQLAESEDCNENGLPDECEGVPIILSLGEEALELPGRPSIIESGDVDGDGDDDLVQISEDARIHTLRVILNDGDRTLVAATEYVLDTVVFSVALGDVDGDGDLDIAAAEETLSREPGLSVFLGNGDGTFARPVRYEHSFCDPPRELDGCRWERIRRPRCGQPSREYCDRAAQRRRRDLR